MSSKEVPTAPSSFTLSWGCQMVAYIINAVLYGMALLLVGQYFGKKQNISDSAITRATVAVLGILATLQFAFLSHQIYADYVDFMGTNSNLDIILFSALAQLLSIYLLAFTTQMFFASRVWIITRHNPFFTIPIVLLALLQLSAGIAQCVASAKVGRYSLLASTARITSTQSGATAACDVLITIILCYILYDARTGVKKTDSMINKMIVYALERGAVTSLCALLNLITFLVKPGTFIFMIFLEPSSQLYVISVLSMLANREGLRGQLNATTRRSSAIINTRNYATSSYTTNTTGPQLAVLPTIDRTESEGDKLFVIQKHIVKWDVEGGDQNQDDSVAHDTSHA